MSPPGGIRHTIAICTLNRGRRAGRDPRRAPALARLAGMRAPRRRQRLNRWDFAGPRPSFLRSTKGNVRALREPRAGLSAARNRAVREASGELLFFLDDDAVPAAGWLEAYIGIFRDPQVAAAGGPVEPVFDGPLPDWLDQRFLPYLSAWDRGGTSIDLCTTTSCPAAPTWPSEDRASSSTAISWSNSGRRGASLRSCEEVELCLRLERGGERIVYVPEALGPSSRRDRAAGSGVDAEPLRRAGLLRGDHRLAACGPAGASRRFLERPEPRNPDPASEPRVPGRRIPSRAVCNEPFTAIAAARFYALCLYRSLRLSGGSQPQTVLAPGGLIVRERHPSPSDCPNRAPAGAPRGRGAQPLNPARPGSGRRTST